MEPVWSPEFLLQAYEAFLLYLTVLLAAFAGVSLLAYLVFLCEACLSPAESIRAHSFSRHLPARQSFGGPLGCPERSRRAALLDASHRSS